MSYETQVKRENTFSFTRTFLSAVLAAPLCFAAIPALAGPAAQTETDMQTKTESMQSDMEKQHSQPAEPMIKQVQPLPEPKPKPEMAPPDPDKPMEDAAETPAMSIITRKAETATGIATNEMAEGEKCYPQDDGTHECICEGEEACADLVASDICEPGTYWGGKAAASEESSDMGGCTKKIDN